MVVLRTYFLMITVEAGLAFGALLWLPEGGGNAHSGSLLWAGRIAALILIAGLAASAWLAYKAYADAAWLEGAVYYLERLSQPQAVFLLNGVLFLSALLAVAALAALAPDPLPDFVLLLQGTLLQILPLLIWLALASLQLLGVLFLLFPPGRQLLTKSFLLSGVILLLVMIYWNGAVVQMVEVNVDMGETDQGAYMHFTSRMYESGYTYPGDFNRMPAYPFLQSLLYRPGISDDSFFLQGKYLNLLLSLILLAALAVIFSQTFRPLLVLNLTMIIGFLIFIFKAGFFQAELLFYFFNFCLFWCMWQLLRRPSLKLAILAGLLAGLAHLTKASILPGLVLFLIFSVLQAGWMALRRWRSSQSQTASLPVATYLVVAPVVALLFLATVFPYIQTSKRITGRYFYNVNSTFYMWYDSWAEARRGTRAHGDRVGWPDMPPEEVPSMSKYLREHPTKKIQNRFINGFNVVMDNMIHSYGYLKYIFIFAGLFLFAILIRWRRVLTWFTHNLILLVFILVYFAVYFLLYFWYAPIASGNRLILAQFIPLIGLLAVGFQSLLVDFRINLRGKSVNLFTVINLAILAILVVDIYAVLTMRIMILYGGE